MMMRYNLISMRITYIEESENSAGDREVFDVKRTFAHCYSKLLLNPTTSNRQTSMDPLMYIRSFFL